MIKQHKVTVTVNLTVTVDTEKVSLYDMLDDMDYDFNFKENPDAEVVTQEIMGYEVTATRDDSILV